MSLPVYEKSCQSRWRERNQFADFRRGQKWEFKKKMEVTIPLSLQSANKFNSSQYSQCCNDNLNV